MVTYLKFQGMYQSAQKNSGYVTECHERQKFLRINATEICQQ